jgi:hypothetical protein
LAIAPSRRINFADELVRLGYCVVYRSDLPGHDFEINGQAWELQTLNSGSVTAVSNALREGLPQGQGRVIVDGRAAGLTYETAAQAIAERQRFGTLTGAVDIRILLGDGREYRWL